MEAADADCLEAAREGRGSGPAHRRPDGARAAGHHCGAKAGRQARRESKTSRFLALVAERYGDLAGIDPAKVSRICSDLAPEVGLNEGAARSALRPRVLAAQAGGVS